MPSFLLLLPVLFLPPGIFCSPPRPLYCFHHWSTLFITNWKLTCSRKSTLVSLIWDRLPPGAGINVNSMKSHCTIIVYLIISVSHCGFCESIDFIFLYIMEFLEPSSAYTKDALVIIHGKSGQFYVIFPILRKV